MSSSEHAQTRRAIWLTSEQRDQVRAALQAAVNDPPEGADAQQLQSALDQVDRANKRQRITLRLVRGYNTGLRLPEDAIPVHLTDAEAGQACRLPLADTRLARLLDPARPARGWRWP